MQYLSFNEEMHRRFGHKMYKIALDGGFTCPNRDGTCGTRGCIFCSGKGSGDFTFSGESLTKQLDYGISLVCHKNREGGYIGYFQSFTNTYGTVESLREKYETVLDDDRVSALAIATRPDCLPPEVISLLTELNCRKPVWVELGLQTIHPRSAEYIRRGYSLEVYDRAMAALKGAGLETVVHIILGLPGESVEDMAETAAYVGRSGANGVKLQLLHILRGTDLAEEYAAGRVKAMTMEEYAEAICACLEMLPENVVIHRLTGDGAKADLLAPLWSADKKRVLNYLNAEFSARNLRQGAALKKTDDKHL